jgi:hypothetical protein
VRKNTSPFGLVDEDSGQLPLTLGSSFKTSDFIVDSLHDGWKDIPVPEQAAITHLPLKVDNGPQSRGVRTQFLKRLVEFADQTGKIIPLLDYPPYHSQYNPIERCGGLLEQHWKGAKRVEVETLMEWANSMTWKGIHPVVKLSRTVYPKGISRSKKATRELEARLERHPLLPKGDILVRPAP